MPELGPVEAVFWPVPFVFEIVDDLAFKIYHFASLCLKWEWNLSYKFVIKTPFLNFFCKSYEFENY